MFCSMIANLPLSYLASFWFDIAASGFSRLIMVHVFTGVAAFIVVAVLQTPTLDLLVGKMIRKRNDGTAGET